MKVEERCQKLRQELRSSGKMMEVCRSSYGQNLFSDPIALHFFNLETSATQLARGSPCISKNLTNMSQHDLFADDAKHGNRNCGSKK